MARTVRWLDVHRCVASRLVTGSLAVIGLVGCTTAYPRVQIHPTFVDLEAQSQCDALWQRSVADGWVSRSDGSWSGFGGIVTFDETWVVHSEAHIVYGRWTRKLRKIQVVSLNLEARCGYIGATRPVPIQMCESGRNRFGVVDGQAVANVFDDCEPGAPLWLEIQARTANGEIARYYETVEARPSLRPWIEVRR